MNVTQFVSVFISWWHLNCFQFGGILTRAAVNVSIRFSCGLVHKLLLDKNLGGKSLSHRVSVCLTFEETDKQFSHVAAAFMHFHQQYVNCELPDVQAGLGKGRGTRDQIANIQWIIEKASEFWKNIYFCFIDYAKPFDCVDHNKLWKILKEMGIPDHLTCLLRNLYAGQEATVRTEHGTDWFQIVKGVRQGCILSPWLFNLYA